MVMRRSTVVRNHSIIKQLDRGVPPKDIVAGLNLSSVSIVYNADRPRARKIVLAAARRLKRAR